MNAPMNGYVRGVVRSAAAKRAGEPALSREDQRVGDLADYLQGRLRAQDPITVALRDETRAWAIDGQRATLVRLGVRFDREILESSYVQDEHEIVERGLNASLFVATPDEAIIFPTDAPDYPALLLRRPDGFSTEHLRYVAM